MLVQELPGYLVCGGADQHKMRCGLIAVRPVQPQASFGWAAFPGGLRPLESFDLQRDQLAFLQPPPSGELMPPGYVHNFLFMASGRELGALIDPTVKAGAPGAQSSARTSA